MQHIQLLQVCEILSFHWCLTLFSRGFSDVEAKLRSSNLCRSNKAPIQEIEYYEVYGHVTIGVKVNSRPGYI